MDEKQSSDVIKNRWPKPGQLVIGILLIVLGAIWLVAQFFGGDVINNFWPLFLVVGGLIFYAAYYLRREKPPGYEGLLFPGTYLMVLGILFILMNLIGWQAMRFFWPTFLFGIVISLGAMYKFGNVDSPQQKSDLISAIRVLTIISVVLYLIAIGGLKTWPLILIIIGVVILYRAFRSRPKYKPPTEE
jgi:phosphatidylserine synthase